MRGGIHDRTNLIFPIFFFLKTSAYDVSIQLFSYF